MIRAVTKIAAKIRKVFRLRREPGIFMRKVRTLYL